VGSGDVRFRAERPELPGHILANAATWGFYKVGAFFSLVVGGCFGRV